MKRTSLMLIVLAMITAVAALGYPAQRGYGNTACGDCIGDAIREVIACGPRYVGHQEWIDECQEMAWDDMWECTENYCSPQQ